MPERWKSRGDGNRVGTDGNALPVASVQYAQHGRDLVGCKSPVLCSGYFCGSHDPKWIAHRRQYEARATAGRWRTVGRKPAKMSVRAGLYDRRRTRSRQAAPGYEQKRNRGRRIRMIRLLTASSKQKSERRWTGNLGEDRSRCSRLLWTRRLAAQFAEIQSEFSRCVRRSDLAKFEQTMQPTREY